MKNIFSAICVFVALCFSCKQMLDDNVEWNFNENSKLKLACAVYNKTTKTLALYCDGKFHDGDAVYWLTEDTSSSRWYNKSISNVIVDASMKNFYPKSVKWWFDFDFADMTILDLSNLDTSQVTDMSYMFYGCSKLKTIYVSDSFDVSKVENSSGMFSGCNALEGGAGTKYSSSHTNVSYARIDGGPSNPGYFTRK